MPTACFTGHRALNGSYYDHVNPTKEWATLRNQLQATIQNFITARNVNRFISGMAIGVDQLAVESVALVRSFTAVPVTLTAALPFPSQANNWPHNVRQRWVELRDLCNEDVAISPDPYAPQKMQVRNEWMVNNSDYVIAVWNGVQKGGTWNCIQYAQSVGKPVFHIHPATLAVAWI